MRSRNNINSDEEIQTKKQYSELCDIRQLPSVKMIEKVFGNYTKFRMEVGYTKDTRKNVKKDSEPKEKISLKEFMKNRKG